MKKTLKILNDLEREGIIKSYALGGAIALLFYAEPALTYDLDVFIFLTEVEGKTGTLIDLGPLYQALEKKGYKSKKEHVIIEGIPVQFIPAYNALVEEGVKKAMKKEYQGIPTKVVRIEHLLAIMLNTNRLKDRERIGRLLEEGLEIDQKKFSQVLSRHGLKEKWEKAIGKVK